MPQGRAGTEFGMTPRNSPGKKTSQIGRASAPSLAEQVVAAPKVASPEAARALLERDLGAAGKELEPLFASHPHVRALIEGIAEGSPYLWDLDLQGSRAARHAPRRRIQSDILRRCSPRSFAAVDAAQDEADAMRQLRVMKAEAALLIALADIGGLWPLQQVTRALTDLADAAVRAARALPAARSGARAASCSRATPHSRSRAQAMSWWPWARWARFELNYSSDVDLIVFFDPDAPALDRDADAGQLYVRVTARAGEAFAGAHGGRLRLPRRSAAAARPGLDAGRGLVAGRAELLRERRPELGARSDDQGARLRRRHRRREKRC